MMKKIWSWVKANPIILLSVVLALAALGGLGVVRWLDAGVATRLADQAKRVSTLVNAQTSNVTLPATQPGSTGESVRLTINQQAIDNLNRVMGDIQGQFKTINQTVADFNKRKVMPGITFPEPAQGAIRVNIKTDYRKALLAMLGRPQPKSDLPGLNAGMPPTPLEVQTAVEAATREFLNLQIVPPKPIDRLSESERRRLHDERLKKLMQVLTERASAIHIYADVPADVSLIGLPGASGGPPVELPLDDSALPKPSDPLQANTDQLWEAQMSLWIQADIVKALCLANHTDDPGSNVLTAPVKRLIKLRVVPGYVGIDTDGAFKSLPGAQPLIMADSGTSGPIADDFTRSPSGRVSNHFFDVRHAVLTVVMQVDRLPELADALAKVNFMSILSVNMQPVDEFDALPQGLVYAGGDVAQMDIVIETLWMRDWTAPLMPTTVKQRLHIPLPPAPTPAP